jgi:D-alanyl-D-alanine carboxypeptidase
MNRRTRVVLVLAVAVAFVVPTGSTVAMVDEPLAATLQQYLDDYRTTRPVLGLAAAVTFADGSRWESGSGLASTDAAAPVFGPDTPTVVGSITKTFVAALTLQLAEQGRMSLDSPLSTWFPAYEFAPRVTVRHLLAHTTGIRDYFVHPRYASLVFGRPTHRWTPQEILTLVKPRLLFEPGTSWSYSNTNYLFLGLIAERVTGRSLGKELRKRFWEPLGMTRTYFQGVHALPGDGAQGYLHTNDGWAGLADGTSFRPHTSAATVAWGVGNVLSTARDIATWTRALYGGTVLSAESLALMLTFNERHYGLGAREFTVGEATGWGHTGSLRGYTAVTWYSPTYGFTMTVLTNRGRINPEVIAYQLGQAIIDAQAGADAVALPAAA